MKKLTNLLLATTLIFTLSLSAQAATMLVPVGQVIGLELDNDTVTVAGFDEALGYAAQAAGLEVGDRILDIDGGKVTCVDDVRNRLSRSDGTVELLVQRKGTPVRLRISPSITPDGPKLGVFLKDGVTGIGTVTFYDPQTGVFGTLGHGVNDPKGSLLQLSQGKVYPASVLSVRKGKAGQPGQLMGSLAAPEPIGSVLKNTRQGVFGTAPGAFSGKAIPTGAIADVHTGQAVIRCNVSGNSVQEYSVEILKIYPAARTTGRNMLIRVCDPALLEATGGIVQGMSGSPIIQDGKLVGAVTHVLVNDPTTGYGIFIENMLDAAA